MRSLSRIPILLLLLTVSRGHPDTTISVIEPVPQIDLEQRRIEGRRLSLRLDEHNLQLDIRAGSRRWETVPPPGGDLTVWHHDAPVSLALADARDKRITAYRPATAPDSSSNWVSLARRTRRLTSGSR